jgi:phage terminase large subunit-like protein
MTLTLEELSPWAKSRLRWLIQARDVQVFPEDEPWDVAFFMGGRGSGKTRAGAEDEANYAREHSHARLAFVGPTFADVRDTMIEGESGILRVLPPSALRGGALDTAWNRSMGELFFANGTIAKGYSSEKPDRLRGPQHHRAWVDEPGAFRDGRKGDTLDTTWNNLMLGLRLGDRPRVIVTGTPKPTKLVKAILARPRLHLVRSSTYENLANLAPTFRDTILDQYEGSRLGRQELLGELLEDVPGALWTPETIEAQRVEESVHDVLVALAITAADDRACVAIDPAVSVTEDSDETGIIGAARSGYGYCPIDGCGDLPADVCHGFVLADETGKLEALDWARSAIDLYDHLTAGHFVVENNQGGNLVRGNLRAVDARITEREIRDAHAVDSKELRAGPVANLYRQGRVHHVGRFVALEAQMTTWVPGDRDSPDRLDALVWALTDLMLGARRPQMRFRGAA